MYISVATFAFAACYFVFITDGRSLGNGPLPFQAWEYIYGSILDVPMDVWNPPQNKNDSLGYRVYTQEHPNKPCFLEPTQEALKKCPINPDNPVILLVHGFIEGLVPGNLFEVLKSVLLNNGSYTVIILDWTKYAGPPVSLAIKNMYLIGPLAADMLKYIEKEAGVKAENMTCIGHSLGGHLCGYIARNIPNFATIRALDPAGIFFTTPPYNLKLSYTDAKFVTVIHTTCEYSSLGTSEALGHFDFFLNGGCYQPLCEFGAQYTRTSGDEVKVNSLALKVICPHELANSYYINSINDTDCQFLGTNCESYEDFKAGHCPPERFAVANMGFYGEQTSAGLPKHSKFYLRTSNKIPFCLKNGFKPLNS